MAKPAYFGSYLPKLVETYATPTAALRAWRAAGGRIEDKAFYRAFAAARQQLALAPWAQGQDLRFAPTGSEILPEPTVRASGYAQRVMVVGRMRNGQMITRSVYVPTGSAPISRAAAIRRAEEFTEGQISSEGDKATDMMQVYGAVHVGAVRREPGL